MRSLSSVESTACCSTKSGKAYSGQGRNLHTRRAIGQAQAGARPHSSRKKVCRERLNSLSERVPKATTLIATTLAPESLRHLRCGLDGQVHY